MAHLTLADICKTNKLNVATGIIDEIIQYTPEVASMSSRVIPGTSFEALYLTSVPEPSFRKANQGTPPLVSQYENRKFDMRILSARAKSDTMVVQSTQLSVAQVLAMEASGIMRGSFRKIGRQLFYGTAADKLGFLGMSQFVDGAATTPENKRTLMKQTLTGTPTPNTASSVYFAHVDDSTGVHLVYGGMGQGFLSQSANWRTETLYDENKNEYDGYVLNLDSWVGLACMSRYAVVRYANITADTGKGLTDEILNDMWWRFTFLNDGMPPNRIYMTHRSAKQWQASRAPNQVVVVGGTQANAPTVAVIPVQYNGVPVTITTSLRDDEPILA